MEKETQTGVIERTEKFWEKRKVEVERWISFKNLQGGS
jgi:hypothetical protein